MDKSTPGELADDAKVGYGWLQRHPFIAGLLFGVVVGFITGALAFR